ncbi:MAG: hypothetical protein LBT78_09255 [Tannerella sp.]|nr:hypothetical protein [Tannerella sp.]
MTDILKYMDDWFGRRLYPLRMACVRRCGRRPKPEGLKKSKSDRHE